MKRGDVVLVNVPYLSGTQSKRRPALVVQADRYNGKLIHTIVAGISSRVEEAIDPAHYLLDPATPIGKASGVHFRSVVRCDRLFTIEQQDVLMVIGGLGPHAMREVGICLAATLGLS